MSDRSKDELRKRFGSPPSDGGDSDNEEQEDAPAQSDEDPSSGVSTSDTSDRSKSGETDEMAVKQRKQVAMYLPKSQREDLVDFYEELDARSKLADGGGIEKNREFYEGVVEFILERRGEFAAELGVELPEDEG